MIEAVRLKPESVDAGDCALSRVDILDGVESAIRDYERGNRYEEDSRARYTAFIQLEELVKMAATRLEPDDRLRVLRRLHEVDPGHPIDRSLAWMRTGRGEKPEEPDIALPGCTLADLEALLGNGETAWIVTGMVPHGGLTILSGDPKSGKSLISYALAVARIKGGRFALEDVEPGPVLHVQAEEKFPTVRHRYLAAGKSPPGLFDLTDSRLEIVDCWSDRAEARLARGFDLTRTAHVDYLRGRIREIADRHGAAPLVILDSLSRLTLSAGPTDGDALGRVAYALDAVGSETGAAVLAIAHNRKPAAGEKRRGSADVLGSVRQTAAAESILQVMRDPDDRKRRILQVADIRDGEAPDPIAFSIDGSVVAWGEVVTDAFSAAGRRSRPKELDVALRELGKSRGIDLGVAAVVDRAYPGLKGRERDNCRARMRKALLFGCEEGEVESENGLRGLTFRVARERRGEHRN